MSHLVLKAAIFWGDPNQCPGETRLLVAPGEVSFKADRCVCEFGGFFALEHHPFAGMPKELTTFGLGFTFEIHGQRVEPRNIETDQIDGVLVAFWRIVHPVLEGQVVRVVSHIMDPDQALEANHVAHVAVN